MWNVINYIDKQQIVANVDVDADAAAATDSVVILKSALIFLTEMAAAVRAHW